MAERRRVQRWGGASGLLAALILTAMLAVGLLAGSDSGQLLQPTDPGVAADLMTRYSGLVQAIVVLDDLFAVAYSGAFLGLAALAWPRSRGLAGVAMAFALATATLDFAENARLLAMAQGIGGEANFSDGALRELHIISQLKYSCSHLATFLFGLALPRRDRLSWTVAILLLVFPVVSTLGFALDLASLARLLLMWLLLALGGWLAWREARANAPSSQQGGDHG
jgi:hypothetical protein